MASLTQNEMDKMLNECTLPGAKANQLLQLLGIQSNRRFGRQAFQGVLGDFYDAASIEVDRLAKRYKSRIHLRAAVEERRETIESVAAPIVQRFGLQLWGEAIQNHPADLIYTIPQDRERILLCTFCYIIHRACMKSGRGKGETRLPSEESDYIPNNEDSTRPSTAVFHGSFEEREEPHLPAERHFERIQSSVHATLHATTNSSKSEDARDQTGMAVASTASFRAPEAPMIPMPRPNASPSRRLRIEPVGVGHKAPLEPHQHRTESSGSQSSDTNQTPPTSPDGTHVTRPQTGRDSRKRTASTTGEDSGKAFASRRCKRDGTGRRVKRRDTSWGASRLSYPNFNHDTCHAMNEQDDISVGGRPVPERVEVPVNHQPIDVGDARVSAEAEVRHPVQAEQAPAELLPRSISPPGTRPSMIVKLKLKFVPADHVDEETAQDDPEPIIGDIPEHIRADVEESIVDDGAASVIEVGRDMIVQHGTADIEEEGDAGDNTRDIVEDAEADLGEHDIAEQQRGTAVADDIASDRFSLTERLLELRSVGPDELPSKAINDVTESAARLLTNDRTHLLEVLGANLNLYERALDAWVHLVKILGDFQNKSGFTNVNVSLADHLATLDGQKLVVAASAVFDGARALRKWRVNCSKSKLDMDRFSTDVAHILTQMSHLLDLFGEKETERLIADKVLRFNSSVFEWFKTPGT